MKLIFKQRMFSWLDSYDIFDEYGNTVFTVRGKLAWGHCLKIYDSCDNYVGMVKERVLTFLPKFEMYLKDDYIGCIQKELSFLRPRYNIDCNGWQIEGNFFEWDYSIIAPNRGCIASVRKELLNWTDTYTINISDPNDTIQALMLVLAIDAEKCSRQK